jgi:nucleoside phosphorylase
VLLLVSMSAQACEKRDAVPGAHAGAVKRPVLVQGAMDVEVRMLAAAIENATEEQIEGWTCWSGTLDGYPVVVSKTLKGMANTAAATALAAQRYHPAAIINQGTAGGHDPDLHVLDIVLGVQVVNIGAFKTGSRARGQGSNFADWQPMDLMHSEGSAGNDPRALTMRRFAADEELLAAARRVRNTYAKGRVAEGSGFRFSGSGCCPTTSPTAAATIRAPALRVRSTSIRSSRRTSPVKRNARRNDSARRSAARERIRCAP